MTNAEAVYLFRHALVRDAAYELQLPGDRAPLHALAFHLIEALHGGPAPVLELGDYGEPAYPRHATDAVAAELAEHARRAGESLLPVRLIYLQRAAQHAESHFLNADARRLWLECAGCAHGALKGECLRRAGAVTVLVGGPQDAVSLFEQALAIQRQAGDLRLEGMALTSIAGAYRNAGRIAEAEQAYGRAMAIHRQVGNRHFEEIALGNLAVLYHDSGRIQEAEGAYTAVLDKHRAAGARRLEGIALGHLAGLYFETGRLDESVRLFQQALAIHTEVGDRRFEGVRLGSLAGVFYNIGRTEDAEKMFNQALAIHREVGNRRSEGVALGNRVMLHQDAGRLAAAEADCVQALAIHREVGNRVSEGNTLSNLGNLYWSDGRLDAAERTFDQALALLVAAGARRYEAIHRCVHARFTLELGRVQEARELWQRGTTILLELGDALEIERQDREMRNGCAKAGIEPFEQAQ